MVGQRLRVDGHFSRTGIQVYRDGLGGEQREYRPDDEVFSTDSLASLRGMPVTVRHPQGVGGAVTPENWGTLAARGVVVGSTGDNAARSNDGGHTSGSVWLHDASAIRQVQAGELVELSVGYTASLETTAGTTPDGERYDAIQRNIRGNHLALLGAGEARGGASVRLRLDADGHCIFDDDGGGSRPEERRMKFTIRADGYDHEIEATDDKVIKALEKDHKADADLLETAEQERDREKARADAAEEKATKAQADLDAAKAELAKPAREQLLVDAKTIAGQDITADTDEEIRRAALEARGIKTDGKSDAYVEARFDAALEIDPTREIRGDGDTKPKADAVELTPEQERFTRIG